MALRNQRCKERDHQHISKQNATGVAEVVGIPRRAAHRNEKQEEYKE